MILKYCSLLPVLPLPAPRKKSWVFGIDSDVIKDKESVWLPPVYGIASLMEPEEDRREIIAHHFTY